LLVHVFDEVRFSIHGAPRDGHTGRPLLLAKKAGQRLPRNNETQLRQKLCGLLACEKSMSTLLLDVAHDQLLMSYPPQQFPTITTGQRA
jgi:hypothetical protein